MNKAEGMGLEPTTACAATDFESDGKCLIAKKNGDFQVLGPYLAPPVFEELIELVSTLNESQIEMLVAFAKGLKVRTSCIESANR